MSHQFDYDEIRLESGLESCLGKKRKLTVDERTIRK